MILLVPVLDFMASEISVMYRLLKCWAPKFNPPRPVSVTPTTTRSIFRPKSRLPPVSPSSSRPPSRFLSSMLQSYSPQLDLCTDAAKVAVRLQSVQSFVASAHELRATVRNSSPAQLQTHARKVGSFPWLI